MKLALKHFHWLTIFLFLLSACSLPVPAETPAAATALPTSPAETSTPPEPTPPPAETQTLLDPCLLGVWTMDTYALNNKFLDLTGSPTMFVKAPSQATLEFRDDNAFAIDSQVTMRFDIPGSSDYMELDGYHQGRGSYAADGEAIFFIASENVVDFGAMRVYIDGEEAEGSFGAGSPPPETIFSPPGDAAYLCSANSLQITYGGPSGPVTEEWNR